MNSLTTTMILAAALLPQTVLAQDANGVPGDRLVVPVPDVSALSDDEARALLQDLARMNVVTSECPDYDVSDPEWQLMTDTTDAVTGRLGLDALAFDREYFRPAFNELDDPAACDRLGPEAARLIERLEAMGGSTQPVTPPGLEQPADDGDTPETGPETETEQG
ncbi:hypothetical protein D3P06_09835 [Paracoccus aestuarii]|uniref:Uncharacterized protein n=1 Tax=Paracoccus aestuarii TaxID=453842 RepID=A0A418ZW08_9RHOB|nr:hypothetical protein [Paracoccus aestuarii]RJL03980.1 hypothetical protein D3P06_09835 [Paracoccus aestuarii]WCQ99321.1 hypothetical protein JHW48_00670 [Paracoccus aestuarii]